MLVEQEGWPMSRYSKAENLFNIVNMIQNNLANFEKKNSVMKLTTSNARIVVNPKKNEVIIVKKDGDINFLKEFIEKHIKATIKQIDMPFQSDFIVLTYGIKRFHRIDHINGINVIFMDTLKFDNLVDDVDKIEKTIKKYNEIKDLYRHLIINNLVENYYIGHRFITANSIETIHRLRRLGYDFTKPQKNLHHYKDYIDLINEFHMSMHKNSYDIVQNIFQIQQLDDSNERTAKFRIKINDFITYQAHSYKLYLSGIFEVSLGYISEKNIYKPRTFKKLSYNEVYAINNFKLLMNICDQLGWLNDLRTKLEEKAISLIC